MYDMINDGSLLKISDNPSGYDLASQNELKGYLFKVRYTGGTVTQVGVLNNNPSYWRTLQDDWQILANPYASYYQLPKQTGATADFANTTGTVYVTVSTRDSDKTFETYNTLTGLSSPETFTGVIAPSQAFYVQRDPLQTGQVFMQASNRIHDVNKVALKTTSKEQDVLRVKLNNGELTDEAVIALRENGDIGFSRIDSEQKFTDSNYSFIYSVVDSRQAVINVVPVDMFDESVKLGVKAKFDGVHTLSITGLNSLVEDYEVVLEDKATDPSTMTKMTGTTVYEFTAAEGTSNDRFVLHFKEPKTEVPTGIDKDNFNGSVKVYLQNRSTLQVECGWAESDKTIAIYTVSGALIMNEDFEGDKFRYELSVMPGLYIVKIYGGNKSYEQKVIVN
jgi:ABC-type antimicrobial peptide transport system permease subunit